VLKAREWQLKVENVKTWEQTSYALNIYVMASSTIKVLFKYNAGLIGDSHIEMIRDHFRYLLDRISKEEAGVVGDIKNILSLMQ
jgi:hypothetical protein